MAQWLRALAALIEDMIVTEGPKMYTDTFSLIWNFEMLLLNIHNFILKTGTPMKSSLSISSSASDVYQREVWDMSKYG